MQYKFALSIVVVLLTAAAPLKHSWAQQLLPGPVKIGVITNLSGPAAYYGTSTRLGVQMAAQELKNRGEAIKVFFEDSALSAQRGLSGAQKLLTIDKVDALFVDFTVVMVAISTLVESQRKPVIYSAAIRSVAEKNPYAFKTYLDYGYGCEALAQEFRQSGLNRIGFLKTEAEYGDLCEGGIRAVYPDAKVLSYKQSEDVSAQVLALKSAGVEAVINASFEGDMLNMLKAMQRLAWRPRIGAPEDNFSSALVAAYGPNLEGALSFGRELPSAAFEERARSFAGREKITSLESVSLAYVHALQLFEAVKNCADRSGACIVAALSKSAPDDLIGFEGWESRCAKLRTNIKEFTAGRFQLKRSDIQSGSIKR